MTTSFTVEPSGHACGATVRGINWAQPVDDETAAAVRAAWLKHRVLHFPGQSLSLDDLPRAARAFGPPGHDPYIAAVPGHPQVIEVKRAAEETTPLFAATWHSDWSFLETPPAGTMLYGVEIPPTGGDTLFADQHAAYLALPDRVRSQLEGLMGIHSAGPGYARDGMYGDKDKERGRSMDIRPSDSAKATQTHPIVRCHPETGEPGLFCSMGYTVGIDGLDAAEARALLIDLFLHQGQEAFVYRHRWSPGDLLLWDNRSVIHMAEGGYEGHARLLWRTTIAER